MDVTDEYFSLDKESINPSPSSLKKSQDANKSLLSGAKGFFGLHHTDEGKKAQIRTEIKLMDAINAHVKWKVRLQDYLDGTSQEKLDPKIICRDDQCVLGKWIQGAHKHASHDVVQALIRLNKYINS